MTATSHPIQSYIVGILPDDKLLDNKFTMVFEKCIAVWFLLFVLWQSIDFGERKCRKNIHNSNSHWKETQDEKTVN